MTRDDLALESEHLDLLDRLAAAKASGDKAELTAAKAAISEFRQHWRGIRAYLKPPAAPGDGVAEPATLTSAAKAASS